MRWREVKGYNGEYLLSEKGTLLRVAKINNAHIVKSCKASNGKLYVE